MSRLQTAADNTAMKAAYMIKMSAGPSNAATAGSSTAAVKIAA